MSRQNVSSAGPWEASIGYSRAVRVGNTIAVSGTTSAEADGTIHGEGDAYLQARRCFEIIERALVEAGAGLPDVVRTRTFLTNIDDWQAVGRAHGEVFGDIRPAATMVAVSQLIDPAMLVEIEADAVLGD